MSGELKNIIEAVLLAADAPLSVQRIQGLFARDARPDAADVKAALAQLEEECEARGIELRKIGNAYRFHSRAQYAEWIAKLHAARPPRMSRALLETLAIIAYRQPVTRGDIEQVRGVSVTTDIMRRLLEREWIVEVGARDLPGRPALFATTPAFLAYFNLESLDELPPLAPQRALGEIAGEIGSPPEVRAMLQEGGDDAHTSQDETAHDVNDINVDTHTAQNENAQGGEDDAQTSQDETAHDNAGTHAAQKKS